MRFPCLPPHQPSAITGIVIPNEERYLQGRERTVRFLAPLEMTTMVAPNREQ